MVLCNHESLRAIESSIDISWQTNTQTNKITSTNRVISSFRCDNNCLIERWTRRAAVRMPDEGGGRREEG